MCANICAYAVARVKEKCANICTLARDVRRRALGDHHRRAGQCLDGARPNASDPAMRDADDWMTGARRAIRRETPPLSTHHAHMSMASTYGGIRRPCYRTTRISRCLLARNHLLFRLCLPTPKATAGLPPWQMHAPEGRPCLTRPKRLAAAAMTGAYASQRPPSLRPKRLAAHER